MLKTRAVTYEADRHHDTREVIKEAFKQSMAHGIPVDVIHNKTRYVVDAPKFITSTISRGIGEATLDMASKWKRVAEGTIKREDRAEHDKNRLLEIVEAFEEAERAAKVLREELDLPDQQFSEGDVDTKYGKKEE